MINKKNFSIVIIDKETCKGLLDSYHYLSKLSKGFKSGINFGLVLNNEVLGVCIFTGLPVPELVKGMFGLERNEQEGIFELSRLCLSPKLQWKKGDNIAGFFAAKCLNKMKKVYKARAILSYADSDFHKGTVYQALNFKYFGLSEQKKDFWFEQPDGSYVKHNRGPTKGYKGQWRPRTQKHRYLLVWDKNLKVHWKEQSFPK